MSIQLNVEETLRDASDEELRNFILETGIAPAFVEICSAGITG